MLPIKYYLTLLLDRQIQRNPMDFNPVTPPTNPQISHGNAHTMEESYVSPHTSWISSGLWGYNSHWSLGEIRSLRRANEHISSTINSISCHMVTSTNNSLFREACQNNNLAIAEWSIELHRVARQYSNQLQNNNPPTIAIPLEKRRYERNRPNKMRNKNNPVLFQKKPWNRNVKKHMGPKIRVRQ